MLLRSFTYADSPVTVLRQRHHILQQTFWTQENKPSSGRVCSLPSPPFVPTRPTSIREDGILHYSKAGNKVVERLETMDGIHKGRKRCTGRGERAMWTALFSHWVLMRLHMIRDTERDRSKQPTTRRIRPPPLSSLPSRPTLTSPNRWGWNTISTRLATKWWKWSKITDGVRKGRKRWEKESCEQRSFSRWVLMRLHMIRDRERDKSRRTNFTLPYLTNHLLFSKNCWQAHSAALIQIISVWDQRYNSQAAG